VLAGLPDARSQAPPAKNLDLYQGPVLAPLRVIGMGGAFAAYAEGVDAVAVNAAAAAVREPYSVTWFDYDLSFSLSFPAAFRGTDFDNDGKVGFSYDNFVFTTLGASVQLGHVGAAVLGDFQQYDLSPKASADDPHLTATLGRVHAVVGGSLYGGQVSIGGGARVVTLSVDVKAPGQTATTLSMNGAAPEIGLLIRPDYQPWRIGATYRAPVEGKPSGAHPPPDPGLPAPPFDPPATIRLPWEIEAGFAIQVGPRPLNPRWLNPHDEEESVRREIADARRARRAVNEVELRSIRGPEQLWTRATEQSRREDEIQKDEDRRLDEAKATLLLERKARYRNWPRPRITVLGEILITGRSKNAISLESLFSHSDKASGDSVSYSPRLGLEGEPVVDYVQTRIGTYIEPSRYEGLRPRQHFTFGTNVRLGAWSCFGLFGDQIWQIGGAADLAPRYQSFGLSIGAWH
jgi:hypothetical protein